VLIHGKKQDFQADKLAESTGLDNLKNLSSLAKFGAGLLNWKARA